MRLVLKYVVMVVFVVIICGLWPQPVHAQVAIQDVAGLRLRLAKHTQAPSSMTLRYDLVIYSQITSDRVRVNWTVSGKSRADTAVTPTSVLLSVVPNHTYFVPLQLVISPGLTQILADVSAFGADSTYTATASDTIVTKDLTTSELAANGTSYTLASIAYWIRTIAIVLVGIIAVALIGVLVFNLFRRWLQRD